MLENTEMAIKNGQSRETGNTGYTRHRTKINVREYRCGNQKWTIQRNWQHRVHKTKKNKTNTQYALDIMQINTNNINKT